MVSIIFRQKYVTDNVELNIGRVFFESVEYYYSFFGPAGVHFLGDEKYFLTPLELTKVKKNHLPLPLVFSYCKFDIEA